MTEKDDEGSEHSEPTTPPATPAAQSPADPPVEAPGEATPPVVAGPAAVKGSAPAAKTPLPPKGGAKGGGANAGGARPGAGSAKASARTPLPAKPAGGSARPKPGPAKPGVGPGKAKAVPPRPGGGPAKAGPAKGIAKPPLTDKVVIGEGAQDDDARAKAPSKAAQANREKRAREIERRKAEAAALAAKKRNQRRLATMAAIVVIGAIVGIILLTRGKPVKAPPVPTGPLSALGPLVTATAGAAGSEGVSVPTGTVLADTSGAPTGQTVDNIQCQASESLVYHIHAHLSIFVDGSPRQVPALIGINNKCLYWMHSHVNDGIIHIESPDTRLYTLGNFFDLWGQPLSPTQLGPISGKTVTVLYKRGDSNNGWAVFTGTDPRSIPLQAHDEIQIDVGTPLVAPLSVGFGNVQ